LLILLDQLDCQIGINPACPQINPIPTTALAGIARFSPFTAATLF